MSSNKDQQQEKKAKKPPPSFAGNCMPDVNIGSMDYVDGPSKRVGAHEPSFTAMAPPSLTTFTSPFGGSSISTLQQKSAGAQTMGPMGMTRTSPPITTKYTWKLFNVPSLPEFHPLERTAVFVENASPSDVSRRISDVLRERSIEASYDNEKAKATCLTGDGVDFRVRMYRGRGRYCHGIIVEVQRRFGASINFHNDTWAILDAAQGKTPPPPPLSIGSGSSSLPLVSDSEDDDYEPATSGADSLNMVAMMMSHAGYDSRYLALQTLSSLTDASKMGASTARSVAAELLRPGNEVGSKVLSHVLDKNEDDMFKLRVMALTIVANAIEAVKGHVSELVREQLRPVLVNELRRADSNPRSAQMAARCFQYLLPREYNIGGIQAALETALEAGQARHAGLMRQAQKSLDVIHQRRLSR